MDKFYLLCERHFFKFLVGTMVLVILLPKFPLFSVHGTFVAIRLEDFVLALLTLSWVSWKSAKFKNYLKEPVIQAVLLFWAIGLLSLISAIFITHSVSTGVGFLNWLRRVEYMLLFPIAATTIVSSKQIKTIFQVFFFATIVIIVYGVGQQWFHFPLVSTTNSEFSKGIILYLTPDARVNSTFAGQYDLAVYLTIILTLIGSVFFLYKRMIQRIILVVFGILNFLLLGLTAARISFAATLVGLTIAFWLTGKKILIVLLIIGSLITLAAVPELRHRLVATLTVNILGGGGAKYSPPPNQFSVFTQDTEASLGAKLKAMAEATESSNTSRRSATISADIAPGEPVNSVELGVYRSFGIRKNVEWPRAIRGFVKNPILGTGYSSLNTATDNDLLRSLGEVGLLGTLSLGLIFFILVKKMLKFIKRSPSFERQFIVGILAGSIAVLLTGTFIDAFEASKVAIFYWFLLGCSWALMEHYRDD